MNELELKIFKMLSDRMVLYPSDIESICLFISKCSLTDFEILKDMEYDLNQKDNE